MEQKINEAGDAYRAPAEQKAEDRFEGSFRSPRPGFISGEEDLLDLDEIDRRNAGRLTPSKIETIRSMFEEFSESPETIATLMALLDVELVRQALETKPRW